jgi:hypothetical protein
LPFSSSTSSATGGQFLHLSSKRHRLEHQLNLLITSVTTDTGSLLLRSSAAPATVWLHAAREQQVFTLLHIINMKLGLGQNSWSDPTQKKIKILGRYWPISSEAELGPVSWVDLAHMFK